MTNSNLRNAEKGLHSELTCTPPAFRKRTKGCLTSFAMAAVLGVAMVPTGTYAQVRTVQVQAPKDAWQVRSDKTQAIIRMIFDPKTSQAERATAAHEFDTILTEADKGQLTPIETMELFGIFYIPKELQKKSPDIPLLLEIVATQATLGWYDALRFADASGRAEIANNEGFFALPFYRDTAVFIHFMKDHPEQSAAAVKAGIQYARDKIENGDIHYNTQWPASFGMLRMQCALQHAKTCEKPTPQPANKWPTLLDQASQQVSNYYHAGKNQLNNPVKSASRSKNGRI